MIDNSAPSLVPEERIFLGPLLAEDSSILFQWINNREQVLRNAAYIPVHGNAHEAWLAEVRHQPNLMIRSIRRREDDSLIGTCQLHSIHAVYRSAELQIRIGAVDARGKGYGKEAVSKLIALGFEDYDLNRIFLRVFKSNIIALKLYRKCGFTEEGTLRQAAFIDGKYEDVITMSMLRYEYNNRIQKL